MRKKEKVPAISNSMLAILPIRNYNEEQKCFELTEGYMDILKLRTDDLNHMTEDEVEYNVMLYAKLYKTFSDDMKIICMNLPCNVNSQLQYFQGVLEKTRNPGYQIFIKRKINELIYLKKNKTNRDFYVEFFCKTVQELEKAKMRILQTLFNGKESLAVELTFDEKIQVLEKISNKTQR